MSRYSPRTRPTKPASVESSVATTRHVASMLTGTCLHAVQQRSPQRLFGNASSVLRRSIALADGTSTPCRALS